MDFSNCSWTLFLNVIQRTNCVRNLHYSGLHIQVEKIEVQYDKSSKQVNIHVLKETLWYHVQEITEVPGTVSIIPFILGANSFSETYFSCIYLTSLFFFFWKMYGSTFIEF